MKKNGFIATSILYAFFLVFVALFVGLILAYMNNQLLISKINDKARDTLSNINNTQMSSLKVGDFVSFKNNNNLRVSDLDARANIDPSTIADEAHHRLPLNSNSKWIVVSKTVNSNNTTTLTLIGDLDALNKSIETQYSHARVPKIQNISINVLRELNGNTSIYPDYSENALARSLLIYDNVNGSNKNNLNFDILDTKLLYQIKNDSSIPENIKSEIFNVKGSYLIHNDLTSGDVGGQYSLNYQDGYYVYQAYNLTSYIGDPNTARSVIQSSCLGSINSNNGTPVASYDNSNPFGYINLSDASRVNETDQTLINEKYVDYCYYSNPTSDLYTTLDTAYDYIRLKMNIVVSNDSNVANYIYGGDGTTINPYIVTDGVRQA